VCDLRWSGDTTSSSVWLVGHQVTGSVEVHLLEHLADHQVVYRKQSQHMLVWMRSHELAGHSRNRHRSQQDYLRNYSARCLALRRTCGLHIVIFLALQFTAFVSAHRWCGCWLCAIVAPFKRHSVWGLCLVEDIGRGSKITTITIRELLLCGLAQALE
jgi:hypothetical protein